MIAKKTKPNDKRVTERVSRSVIGLLIIAASYGVGSRAWDTGSWWEYAFTLILLISGFKVLLGSVKIKGNNE